MGRESKGQAPSLFLLFQFQLATQNILNSGNEVRKRCYGCAVLPSPPALAPSVPCPGLREAAGLSSCGMVSSACQSRFASLRVHGGRSVQLCWVFAEEEPSRGLSWRVESFPSAPLRRLGQNTAVKMMFG